MKAKKYFSIILILILVLSSVPPGAVAQSTITPVVSLFAKAGTGDYYTIYPTGLKKEDSYIGGFKSVQLDPQEENIYFYDTVLKVIARINIQDGKVYKVIGKPKSSTVLDYRTPVKFADASLGALTDFTFDKYGNIYILIHNKPGEPSILKASLKDNSVKEVLSINDQFRPMFDQYLNPNYFRFNLAGLSYDHDRFIYFFGSITSLLLGFGIWHSDYSTATSQVVLKFDPLSNSIEIYAGTTTLGTLGFTPKIILGSQNNDLTYFGLNGVSFDHNGTRYIGTSDYVNSVWSTSITKLVPSSNNDGTFTEQAFVGDGTGSISDIGDGGQAKSAYAGISGANCFCGDKNGDIYFADISTNRIRKILNDSGLITTAVGGGSETLTYSQLKAPRGISLQSPNSILVDKANNLYIAEKNRILTVTNLITHDDKPSELVKIANLAITKIAGNEIKNPKGDVALPDLKLDYTFSGDQTVEVKGSNIPDGTNIKLLSINTDGTTTATSGNGKLTSGITSIPVKIEAGTTKVIKAETDPFIPAPGVYLPGSEPKTASGALLPEPQNLAPARDAVNLSGNLILPASRFNFSWANWRHPNVQWNHKPFTVVDPDNAISNATQIDFATKPPSVIYYDVPNLNGKNSTFSIWLRTDSGNANVLVGIGPSASGYDQYIKNDQLGNAPLLSYTTASVTPVWQKFTVISNANITNYNKSIFISGQINGQNLAAGQKVYLWGARIEQSQ